MRALLLTVALCACTAAETLEPPTGATYKFVLSDYVRPSVWADLPPRGSNTLDFAFSWLAHVGFDAGAGAREIMQRGDILLLAELQVPEATDVLANPTASVSMFSGANPQPPPCSTMEDTVCGDHLEGDAHFDVATAVTVQPLLGTLGDRFEVGTGDLAIAIPFLAEVVPLDLLGARVEVASVTPSALRLVLRGAVARDQIRDRLVSLWATKLEKKIARDCGTREMPSSCGCVTRDGEEYGSADLLGIFDHRPADCRITVDEIMTNSLVISLLSPDVTLDGVPAVTFNIGFAAVPAEFTAPP